MNKLFTTLAASAVALSASAGVSFENYVSVPATGDVTEISSIEVKFPGCAEIEINDSESIYIVNANQEKVAGEPNVSYGTNVLTFTPDATITAPGTYRLCIGEWTLCGYDENYESMDNPSEIILEYTIKSQGGSDIFGNPTVMPAQGTVTSLETITISFPDAQEVSLDDKSKVSLTHDGENIADFTITDGNELTIKLSQEMAAPGEYVLTIPANTLKDPNGTNSNQNDLVFKWSILTPVSYDLTLTFNSPIKPNADGEISAEKQLTAFFFVSDAAGLDAASGTEDNVTIREINGDFEKSGHLQKAYGLYQDKSYFSVDFGSEPRYNGKYEIIIAKGAFGDAEWLANPEFGHSNEEIVLTFTLVDGADRNFYTIEPVEVTPSETTVDSGEKLREFAITFDTDVTLAADAYATLAGREADFNQTAAIETTDDSRTFKVTFDTVPSEVGVYVFNVLQGAFIGTEGNMSVEISKEYKIDGSNTIDAIVTENDETSVYNLQGVRVDADKLPAGIYIINGKKVAIK